MAMRMEDLLEGTLGLGFASSVGCVASFLVVSPVHVINTCEVPGPGSQVRHVTLRAEWCQMMSVFFMLHHGRKVGGSNFSEKKNLLHLVCRYEHLKEVVLDNYVLLNRACFRKKE